MAAALRIFWMGLRRTVFAHAAGWLGPALLAALLASGAAAQATPDCADSSMSRTPRDAALRELACDTEEHPRNLDLRNEYARRLALAHRYNDALNQYQYVLQQNPENARARLGMAKIMSWQSRFDVAQEMYEQLLHDNPGYYDALVGRAFNLLWMGEKTKARDALIECRAVHPDDYEVISALSALGERTAREDGAAGGGRSPRHGRSAARGSAHGDSFETPPEELPPLPIAHVPDVDDALAWLMPYRPLVAPIATALFLFAGFFGLRTTFRQIRLPLILAGLRAAKSPILLAASSLEPRPVNRNTVYRARPRPSVKHAAAAPVVEPPPAQPAKAAVVPEEPGSVHPAVAIETVSDAPSPEVPKRVLVAEDEKPVLEFVRETLEAAGVHVIACERGADALEHLRDRAFDGIIADAALPGIPGNELYCWLAENRPGAEKRLMLALPHAADERLQRFIDKTGVLCISRPFAVPDLVIMTRLLLERSRLRSAPPN